MALRAVFFDVGDTLVQHWKPFEETRVIVREALLREFGEREWYESFLSARFEPLDVDDVLRQETNRWYAEWFRNSQIGIDDIDIDRLRSVSTPPLDLVGSLVPGSGEALRWVKERGLAVGLITNTFSRGDDEVRTDWERFGLADHIDHITSSHSAGWMKPHEQIYRRALAQANVAPEDAVMVGDRMRADVWGAKRLGLRAVWRRPVGSAPQDPVDVVPDATIDDLTELPGALAPWL